MTICEINIKTLLEPGLTPEEYWSQQVQASQYLGGVGGSDKYSGANFRITTLPEEYARTDKAFGLTTGSSMEAALGLRQAVGMGQARNAPEKMVEIGVSYGLRKELAPYLKSMVSLLSNISPEGMVRMGPMSAMIGDIVRDTGLAPEAAAHVAASMHEGIKGAQGDQAAAIQMAYTQAGIAKNPQEAQFLMSLGKRSLTAKSIANLGLSPQAEAAAMDANLRHGALIDAAKFQGAGKLGQYITFANMHAAGSASLAGWNSGKVDPGKEIDLQDIKYRSLKASDKQYDRESTFSKAFSLHELGEAGRGLYKGVRGGMKFEAEVIRAGRIFVQGGIETAEKLGFTGSTQNFLNKIGGLNVGASAHLPNTFGQQPTETHVSMEEAVAKGAEKGTEQGISKWKAQAQNQSFDILPINENNEIGDVGD